MSYRWNGQAIPQQGEKGYAWYFFAATRSWITGIVITLLVIGAGGGFYLWYNVKGTGLTPDSGVGLGYAIVGFTLIMLAATSYTLRRRFRGHGLGQLNRSLNWHILCAIIGLTFIFMHSFGSLAFDSQTAESGTLALGSFIALVLCGILGRLLDRFLAWRIAVAVDTALTAEGDDRMEVLEQEISAMVSQGGRQNRAALPVAANFSSGQAYPFSAGIAMPGASSSSADSFAGSWDLAYFSPERQIKRQEAPAAPTMTTDAMATLRTIQQATSKEQMCRRIIRGWRMVHIGLAILTLSLIAWHIIAAFGFISATAGN